ncbi:AraC family transcriptional regulator [candidate division KSB1 bacterium]|nr:AraC family transcriptional regulator [candidate division KSB1 bacterium]
MNEKESPVILQSQSRAEYISRINRVLDYIEAHLDAELSLQALAKVATFSPFHFHRIFKAIVGETLNQFILRLRVEKAAGLLVGNPNRSITEVALDCGFSSSATFARAFKDFFHISASQWRHNGRQFESKIGKLNSNDDQAVSKKLEEFDESSYYIDGDIINQTWRIRMQNKNQLQANIEVKTIPEMAVAYVRHVGPYKGNEKLFENLFNKLMKWAGPRELLRFPETQCLVVYHDNPEITDEDKLRTSACISIPKDTPVEGEIGKMTIAGGRYAIARFEITSDQFQDAWDTVCGVWLPDSGYQPEDGPCFEIYHNNHQEHPERKHIVDICVPVKPL